MGFALARARNKPAPSASGRRRWRWKRRGRGREDVQTPANARRGDALGCRCRHLHRRGRWPTGASITPANTRSRRPRARTATSRSSRIGHSAAVARLPHRRSQSLAAEATTSKCTAKKSARAKTCRSDRNLGRSLSDSMTTSDPVRSSGATKLRAPTSRRSPRLDRGNCQASARHKSDPLGRARRRMLR